VSNFGVVASGDLEVVSVLMSLLLYGGRRGSGV